MYSPLGCLASSQEVSSTDSYTSELRRATAGNNEKCLTRIVQNSPRVSGPVGTADGRDVP